MLSASFDHEADALYIKLRTGAVARTVGLNKSTLVDVDSSGAALGVEIIHPAGEWPVEEFIARFGLDITTAATVRLFAKSARSQDRSFGDRDSRLSASGASSELVTC